MPGGWQALSQASSNPAHLIARRVVDGPKARALLLLPAVLTNARRMLAYSGVDNTTPPEDVAIVTGSAAFHPATTVTAPSRDDTYGKCSCLHMQIGIWQIGASGTSASGETAVIAGANAYIAVTSKAQPSAGATGTSTLTMGGNQGTWYPWSLALRPAAGVDPVPGAPSAVTNLQETHDSTSASFTWTNPGQSDFAGVMIRRCGATPPATASDGTLVTSVD